MIEANDHATLTDTAEIINLPKPITDLLGQLTYIDTKIRESVEIPAPKKTIYDGHAAVEAEQERIEQAKRKVEDFRRHAYADRKVIVGRTLPTAIVEHANAIITGPLREKVAELVEGNRDNAQALARYVPDYDANQILASANREQIKAFQAAVEPSVQFETLRKAWRFLLGYLLPEPGNLYSDKHAYPGYAFLRDIEGGGMLWGNPNAIAGPDVPNDPVRGRMLPWNHMASTSERARINLLTVANTTPDAKFRFANPTELVKAYNTEAQHRATRRREQFVPCPPLRTLAQQRQDEQSQRERRAKLRSESESRGEVW